MGDEGSEDVGCYEIKEESEERGDEDGLGRKQH